ncbi:MAG: helicase-exonuclease AddAB subunit AddA, partial [Lachnospiraceae bacterium]|nr:helicase-exonuclease AddAB subunit AddA [Lachnospiraceae bacterium]
MNKGMQWTKEQEQVIFLGNRNILVSAAAGSGKTATLVERIIQRVAGSGTGEAAQNKKGEGALVDIDRLLIVTFTRAAAAEMRERIGAAIEERRLQQPENKHLQRQAMLLHSAQITTIDSFCLSVIRDYFHEIDLDPVFRVAEEEELTLLRHEVIADVLEEAYDAGEEDFLSFAQNYGGRHQDLKLEDYILRLFQFSESCPWPKEWLEDLCGGIELDGQEGEVFSQEWLNTVVHSIKRRLDDALCWNGRALAICGEPDGPAHYAKALQDDAALLEELLALRDYRALSKAFDGIKFTALSRKAAPECTEEKKNLVKAMREQVKECIRGIAADFFFQDYAQMEEDERGAARYVRVMVKLTLSFREKFAQKKAEKRVLDFSDIEHFALDILTEKKDGILMARTAAKELRLRFEEIMVDEYQDSNEVQEAILRSISREEEGSPNIFMVGDMKQSIYRFRLAKPELFLEKYNSYSVEGGKYQRIDLHRNFRSRREVLDSVNELFFRLMGRGFGQIEYDEAAALYPGAQYLKRDKGIDNVTELLLVQAGEEAEDLEGEVDLTESLSEDGEDEEREYSKREQEALACARKIKEYCAGLTIQTKDEKNDVLLRPCRYGDIVVLLRTMSGWAEVFAKVLTEQGIPAVSDTQGGYFNVPEIKWLLNYLRILDNPRQDIPYCNVLLSPFVGLTTDELAALRAQWRHMPLGEAVRRCAASFPGDGNEKDGDGCVGGGQEIGDVVGDTARRLADFLRIYDMLRERSRILTVPELLEELFEKTGYNSFVAAMPAGGRRSKNLAIFVEKAAAFGQSSYRGLFQFVRYVERLIEYEVDYGEAAETAEGEDAVRIMSIHRSKGLEFPVVFVCGLTKKFNFADTRERLLFHPDGGLAMDYIDGEHRTVVPTLRKKVLKQQMEEEMLSEELRLLYVAMTRAKEKLCMIGYVENYGRLSAKWEAIMPGDGQKLFFLALAKAKSCLDFIGPVIAGLKTIRLTLFSPFQGSMSGGTKARERDFLYQQFLNGTGKCFEPDEAVLGRIRDYLAFDYPYAVDSELPFKVSVSELKNLADGEDEFETPQLYPSQDAIPAQEDEECNTAGEAGGDTK